MLVVQIINILTAGLLTTPRLQTKGERSQFYHVRLSDYVVSGMHDNFGTLEYCGARCQQCLRLARYLHHHHEGARVETEL